MDMTPHVLIVDDMAVNQKIMASMLSPYGITSDFAENGEKCFAMCKEREYGMIFLDQQMPGVYGTETMVYLKQLLSGRERPTPVICYTSNHTPDDLKDYEKAGFAGLLPKPADPEHVREIVEKFLPQCLQ